MGAMVGGGGGVGVERGSRGKKKPGNLFCRYADMKAFEEPQWEVKKTDLSTPLLVSPQSAKHEAKKMQTHTHTHGEEHLCDTIITGRKCGVHTGDVHAPVS